jgi:hypothetical protein
VGQGPPPARGQPRRGARGGPDPRCRAHFAERGGRAHLYAPARRRARLAILRDNRQTILTGQHIAERLNSGAATRFDAATAGTQLAAIDARLPLAEREAAENRNALALLAGLEPHGLDALLAANAMGEDTAPGLPAGLPSDLARQRPDIQAAEAALHAATARIGVARADFYPSVSLSGSLGLQSLALSDLPLWNARQFVVGPVLSLPIFQGGRLAGRLELAKAEQQVAALRYRATVLRAWHEIDDALETWRTADARLAATRAGVEQSRIAAHVSERRYGAGATGYVAVLVAQQARLDREAEWIEARTERAVALTALYKALGGGWTPPRHERGGIRSDWRPALAAPGLGLRLGTGLCGILLAAMMAGLNDRVTGITLGDFAGARGLAGDDVHLLGTVYEATQLAAMPVAHGLPPPFAAAVPSGDHRHLYALRAVAAGLRLWAGCWRYGPCKGWRAAR